MKPIVGRFVLDQNGPRIEVSTQTFAELWSRKLLSPVPSSPLVWTLDGLPVAIKESKVRPRAKGSQTGS